MPGIFPRRCADGLGPAHLCLRGRRCDGSARTNPRPGNYGPVHAGPYANNGRPHANNGPSNAGAHHGGDKGARARGHTHRNCYRCASADGRPHATGYRKAHARPYPYGSRSQSPGLAQA